jgi:hypothetical protein
MWRSTDENEVHKPGCKFDVNMETGDKYVWDDDPPGFSVDADAMGQFAGAMFRHADKGSYVSLRVPAKKVGGSVFIARADLLSMIEAAPSYIEARAATTA